MSSLPSATTRGVSTSLTCFDAPTARTARSRPKPSATSPISPTRSSRLSSTLRGESLISADERFEITRSRLHGHVAAVLGTPKKLGFDRGLASRRSQERDRAVAHIAARVLAPTPVDEGIGVDARHRVESHHEHAAAEGEGGRRGEPRKSSRGADESRKRRRSVGSMERLKQKKGSSASLSAASQASTRWRAATPGGGQKIPDSRGSGARWRLDQDRSISVRMSHQVATAGSSP